MEDAHLESLVLKHVNRSDYKPVKPREIAKRLRLSDGLRRNLKQTIKRLVKRGQLEYGSNHIVRPAGGRSSNRVTGIFRRTSRGFGFVQPSGSTPDENVDIYIAERKSRDAASGDLVVVRVAKTPGAFQKQRGEIVDVLERETHQFVGSYFEDDGLGLVRVDGDVFGTPVLVPDASAKNAHPGDKVVIEMVHFPSHSRQGEAVIREVLGQRGSPEVDTLTIIREYHLPDDFPEDVLKDARDQAEQFDESPGDRDDLTDRTVITIDPKDARDFDDAISLERVARRHWRLDVHIADVAHFVRPRSPLDREARDRATSVYLPDRVIPMLPETISNNLASLQPGHVRFTLTASIEFTPEGTWVNTEFSRSAIKSKRRFTYEEVDDFLEAPSKWKRKLTSDVHRLLLDMHHLAMILRARRFQRGSLELSLPETKIDLDQQGRVRGAHVVENTESHQIIEEFMLAANQAVAEALHDRELPFLRRIHESPEPRKLNALTRFVRELGIETQGLESRFEMQRVLQHVQGLPQEYAVNYAVLRSFQKAVYSPQEEEHYALASRRYCHFTSPIRRYPDLMVHRLIDAVLRGRKSSVNMERLTNDAEHCSEREQRAERAERELTKLKLLDFLSKKIGEQMDAVITGVEEFGLFAQGIELPAEGLIHISSLRDDNYRFDRATHSLAGARRNNSFRLGDPIRVEIARVDLDARRLDYRLIQRLGPNGSTVQQKSEPRRRKKTSSSKPKSRRRKTAGKTKKMSTTNRPTEKKAKKKKKGK